MLILGCVTFFFVLSIVFFLYCFFFFFNDTATTEIYTLSLHDALPISSPSLSCWTCAAVCRCSPSVTRWTPRDRKSTRLNSSHRCISYAVFCLKKKKKTNKKKIKRKNKHK